MQLATRPWTTTAVALVGAGSIAAIPVAQPLPDLLDLQSRAVRLTSGIDPFTAWVDVFNTAQDNLSTLADNHFLAPAVGLQQVIVNQVGYLDEVINNPSKIPDVLAQIGDNLKTVWTGITGIDATSSTLSTTQAHTLDLLHALILSELPSSLPPSQAGTIEAILNVLASPRSGELIGILGPCISPWVALGNSIDAIVAALQAGDTTTALNDLLAVPANFVGGFLNGATLNLDALVPLINDSGFLPSGTSFNSLDLALGGLLSPGSVEAGPYTFYDKAGDVISQVPAVGGSMFNSVGINLNTVFNGTPINNVNIPGEPIGPLGALESHSQIVGALLGSTWDGKGAHVPVPPLSTLTFPTLDSSAASAVDPSAATDLTNLLAGDTLSSFNLGDLADLPDHLITALLALF